MQALPTYNMMTQVWSHPLRIYRPSLELSIDNYINALPSCIAVYPNTTLHIKVIDKTTVVSLMILNKVRLLRRMLLSSSDVYLFNGTSTHLSRIRLIDLIVSKYDHLRSVTKRIYVMLAADTYDMEAFQRGGLYADRDNRPQMYKLLDKFINANRATDEASKDGAIMQMCWQSDIPICIYRMYIAVIGRFAQLSNALS